MSKTKIIGTALIAATVTDLAIHIAMFAGFGEGGVSTPGAIAYILAWPAMYIISLNPNSNAFRDGEDLVAGFAIVFLQFFLIYWILIAIAAHFFWKGGRRHRREW